MEHRYPKHLAAAAPALHSNSAVSEGKSNRSVIPVGVVVLSENVTKACIVNACPFQMDSVMEYVCRDNNDNGSTAPISILEWVTASIISRRMMTATREHA
mmetsp:Transcript_25625/g.26036  ORF Transcript_25625/g.26036 Transcript_25625/m.26036 type:complete len:100 (-) Transcript_25625:204-503(-)